MRNEDPPPPATPRDWAIAVLALVALAGASGLAIDRWRAATTRDVRGIRVVLETRAALTGGARPSGELTIVAEGESTRYPFLNKRRYLVHTASAAREGTALRADRPEDKARADRHAEVRRKERPLKVELDDGSWRVTLADGARSAELHADPPPVKVGSIWKDLLLLALLPAVLLLVVFGRRKGVPRGSFVGALLLGGLAIRLSSDVLGAAALESTRYLIEAVGKDAPVVRVAGIGLYVLLLFFTALVAPLVAFATAPLGKELGARMWKERGAYVTVAPAMVGLGVLVGIPFVVGIGLSLFHHAHGVFTFVGLNNFRDIISAGGVFAFRPQTLPYSLVVTVLWTALNVTLHLAIGLALALLLRRVTGPISKVYRILLIVPWAVPSYLTALIWRSMFDPDVGVVNRVLGLEGMSWMHDVKTAFAANLATNVWLGVPFMMVVCLGALTSIPEELYEAAEVDGASRFRQLVDITLPLLKPALLPALLLGSIWTFNKFEVIYLVSEGRPDGATDILVTEAYRWAFERGLAQGGAYGYAAAYSVVIFVVLLLYGWMSARVTKAAEEALR